MYFDAAEVFFTSYSLLFRLALAILCSWVHKNSIYYLGSPCIFCLLCFTIEVMLIMFLYLLIDGIDGHFIFSKIKISLFMFFLCWILLAFFSTFVVMKSFLLYQSDWKLRIFFRNCRGLLKPILYFEWSVDDGNMYD